jgi:splicing factor 3B subunit 1
VHKQFPPSKKKTQTQREMSETTVILPKKRSRWDEKEPSTIEPRTIKKSKWDQQAEADDVEAIELNAQTIARQYTPDISPSLNGNIPNTPRKSRWDETPQQKPFTSRWDATPQQMTSKWDELPQQQMLKSKWDQTPLMPSSSGMMTPVGNASVFAQTPNFEQLSNMTPEAYAQLRIEHDIDERNKPFTDEELDQILPKEGYVILEPPADYKPLKSTRVAITPIGGETPYYSIPEEIKGETYGIVTASLGPDMPELKQDDMKYFSKLFEEKDEDQMTDFEKKERRIMTLLLKIKNGTPPMRKQALRYITDKAREFGPEALFNQVLPLLMSPTLEDQERHLLVKVIDRILYKLDDLVRPYVHKILVVILPLLIDEDYYARVEGREIISNLAKSAGLATMISTMRPDIDNPDEYVRNTTARAFAVVASALGIPSLVPFLRAVCQSKKSWQARHTAIKIVQQIAILMGYAILPHLKQLVSIVENGLEDNELKVKTISALAIAALAEASAPYGIESFDNVLRPLWQGLKKHKGKTLAAFLKAVGFIIPLMDPENANRYTKNIMDTVIQQFTSSDEEMKKIVLKVVKQCVSIEGIEPEFVRTKILPKFFESFWVRTMAPDRRNYKQLIETTVELANSVGLTEIISRLVLYMKDESEQFRRLVMETISQIITNLGAADIDDRLASQLVDGALYAFCEQSPDDNQIILNGFGTIAKALGRRMKPFLPSIAAQIKLRLTNKSAKIRQQAADLTSKVAEVMKLCDEEKMLSSLGLVLNEYLGEEYPEVLGSILGGLKAIVNVIGMENMTPPIGELLPRLSPILKNRHEKVQENCIDLVGKIADRGPNYVSPKEWMRICFELLELLKAHKKSIRRAAVNTFGYIAKAVTPADVLATLLQNLRVQERQNRVCTTVAIAIVAETCSPFTVLPALMNEYRVPELNVQNGVLKSLSFLFEYIGEMGKDYIYAVTPLLEDALMDRDLVHRQTACSVVKHMALGVWGLGCEDALLHLLNYIWPNIFETSPHVINAVMEAIEALRVALGPNIIMQYVLQGLFHPARKVRNAYWKIYNNLYIGAQDALVATYPVLPDEEDHIYSRSIFRG